MPDTKTITQSGSQDIDGLLSGVAWDTNNLTFSFPTQPSQYGYGGERDNNFESVNTAQKAVVYDILDSVSSVANLTFTEVGGGSGDLRFAMSDSPSTAWAYYPSTDERGGDSWYGNSSGLFDNPVLGNYAYYAFMHEIGHALGLKHGHEGSVYGAMTFEHDSMEYSIMTYKSYVGSDARFVYNETWGYAQSLMMYDIAAIQHMYGANFTTHSENTTYSWSPTTGEMFVNGVGQGTPGGNRIFLTVWDGGGQDTYDFSNYTTDLTINLQPGEWSTTSSAQLAYLGDGHYARGNIANALLYEDNTASLIENAIGGSGSDMMIGNSTANRLEGHTGDDTLRGEAGNDTLRGGAGNDILDGGADDDILDGGTGNDIFIATPNDGNDFIYDFHQGQDLIEVKDYHYLIAPIPEDKQLKLPEKAISHLYRLYEFSNLRIEVADANSDGALDSIIHLDANNSVTAYNVSSLTAADFLFVA